ncbi:hypothetical protein BOX15_Mlig015408g3 [Macrostomum lignano]|uniref:Uncharacterized protein n=2 Tax=Macrostomum lignano TaxID=282301 RepID=A0A267FBK9_9PLAT|nr:hypothetical protein BOX15_Mlig015408g3 [Macrostomum lignano]
MLAGEAAANGGSGGSGSSANSAPRSYGGHSIASNVQRLCLKILETCRLQADSPELRRQVQFCCRVIDAHDTGEVFTEADIDDQLCRRFREQHRELDVANYRNLRRSLREARYFRRPVELQQFLFRMSCESAGTHQAANGAQKEQLIRLFTKRQPPPVPPPPSSTASRQQVKRSATQLMPSAAGTAGMSRSPSAALLAPPDAVAASSDGGATSGLARSVSARQLNNNSASQRQQPQGRQSANSTGDLSELDLLRELLYCLQGIDGGAFRYDPNLQSFQPTQLIRLPPSTLKSAMWIAECGWLHRKIKLFVEAKKSERTFGCLGQSFCAALHAQLKRFCELLAAIESQLAGQEDSADPAVCEPSGMTLKRLAVWVSEPHQRLRLLAGLVDACRTKKGGALVSEIYAWRFHGNPEIEATVAHLLTEVCKPLFHTVCRWILDGELEDTCQEFFVAANPTVGADRLWQSKYTLRKNMIPRFITAEQARKILLTGKAINFLRLVCGERRLQSLRPQSSKTVALPSPHAMLSQTLDPSFDRMVSDTYRDASQHLLRILFTKYHFIDHLKALRRYLLLGQGDFICHLMDLLEADLSLPAGQLYAHNLFGILETAKRATNAQFEPSYIIERLDVRKLDVSPGDTGWDVFSLYYNVDGPLSTVLTDECLTSYLRAFNFLWRSKRMEHILAGLSRKSVSEGRRLAARMPRAGGLLHRCQLIGHEMAHFVQQFQYYVSFETLECAWLDLLAAVKGACDLDAVIGAHQRFLATVVTRCLLDERSREILTQLRAVFDLIIQYEHALGAMFDALSEEAAIRDRFEDETERATKAGKWGLGAEREEAERARRRVFDDKSLSKFDSQLKVIQQSYWDLVTSFLRRLDSHADYSLRFLSTRIDFNGHYSRQAPSDRPSKPKGMKHQQHRRTFSGASGSSSGGANSDAAGAAAASSAAGNRPGARQATKMSTSKSSPLVSSEV